MAATTKVSSREQQKKATYEHLLECAFDQFCLNGFAATRVADVAQAAGVAHGTAFVHFPTRDTLVSAVIKQYASQIALRLHELAHEGADIHDVLFSHLQGLGEREAFYARLVIESPTLDESARITLIEIQSAISEHLATAYERGVAQGKFRAMPTWFVFNTWIGLIHHYLSNRDLFAPDGSVLDRWGPLLAKQFISLISTTGLEEQ